MLISAALSLVPAAAQPVGPNDSDWAGKWVFMVGSQALDLHELNARSADAGFSPFSEKLLSLGGGGWAVKDRFVIGGNGHALIAGQEASGALRASLSGGYGQIDVGYQVVRTGPFTLTPTVGVGAGGMSLALSEMPGPASFDDFLVDPPAGSQVSSWGFVLDGALSAEMSFRLSDPAADGGHEGGLTAGLRLGYALSPADWSWVEVSGGPDFAVTGAYLRLMLGGWVR
ncbi:MAG: hypothetical protein P8188_09575 [Gemmatimonadota bacterium]